jgi:uncharacterized protein YqeY
MLREKIDQLIEDAIKADDLRTAEIYQNVKKRIDTFKETRKVEDLTNLQEYNILKSMIKFKKDAYAQYVEFSREKLDEEAKFEYTLLEQYIPTPPTAEEVYAAFDEANKDVEKPDLANFRDSARYVKEIYPTTEMMLIKDLYIKKYNL